MTTDIKKLLSRYAPEIQAITKALVATATKNAPEAQEKVYFGWRNIMYSYGGMKKTVCAIGPLTAYVNVYFFNGIHLKDPHKLLEGAGKKVRHVKVRSVQEARRPALAKLIGAAAAKARGIGP